MAFWKRQKYTDKKIKGCQGLKSKGRNDPSRGTAGKFFRSDGLFCTLTVMVFKHIYISIKTLNCSPKKRVNFTIFNLKNME